MTHKQLVKRMAQWLKITKGLKVVISELKTWNIEIPDVIAWNGSCQSILIECKVSRADYLADTRKTFRIHAELGMGDMRYYAAPKGMLKPEEIPDGWGLLEVGDRYVKTAKEAERVPTDKKNECVMLLSALRRLEISTAVYVVAEPPGNQEEAGG